MGRLNYTNRKIDGVKLGQVCAKDLQKRIPPASGYKAALRDPVVELDVSSKALTDRGCVEVTGGLIRAYNGNREDSNIFWLEELNLRDNALTPVSLWSLSEVIRLASDHLRDLDLSNNSLCINSREDTEAWDHFLYSLSGCCVLRRIDFSGNDLGCKGFETLAKAYSQALPVDFVLPPHLAIEGTSGRPSISGSIDGLDDDMRSLSIGSRNDNNDTESGTKAGKPKGSLHASRTPEKHGHSSIEEELFHIYSTTRGLRSVPYIVLSNTSIDDTSALHLSYVLANHHTPAQLLSRVPSAKAGSHAQQLLAYDTETGCMGVVYLPNASLSSAASKVLELAEIARRTLQNTPRDDTVHVREISRGIETADGLPKSPAFSHPRRSPTMIGDETQEAITTELDRARSRIQGNAIDNAGHKSNDLWRVSFRMLSICRCIRPQTTSHAPLLNQAPKPKPPIIRTLDVPGLTPKKAIPWGVPLTPRSVNQTLTQRPKPRKPSISTIPISATTMTNPLKATKANGSSVARRDYRSKLPCGFPEDVWARILGHAAGANGLLSQGQQKSVLAYAMDRGNLKKEREALGLKEAAQKWHILEDMDCLAYEMR